MGISGMTTLRCVAAICFFTRLAVCQHSPPAYRNTAPGVAYVGSEVCGRCHPKILRSFRQTGMGRSMASVHNGPLLETARQAPRITSEKLSRTFEVFAKDRDLYQSEAKMEANKLIFKTVHPLEYAVGSGDHGYSFVIRRGEHLFQAPLSLYSRTGTWDFSPGYEFADYGFNRPIQAACIVCHSGGPRAVPERNGLYRDPPFRELAIGCENCHGPGELHVKERTRGVVRGADTSIVNPARLPARLAENICMNCHQGGDARVLQPGKDYIDFRPGMWLSDTLAIFKIRTAVAADTDLLEHHAAMAQSRCFTGSAGKLSCLTCHDPHTHVAPVDAPAYFRARCLTCHTDNSCRLPAKARQPRNNCAGCHMPARDAAVISHSTLTNHRIVARIGQLAPATVPPVSSEETDLDFVNAPPGGTRAAPPLTLLRAYGELMGRQPLLRTRYTKLLDELARKMPNDAFVQGALGRKLLYDAPDNTRNIEALEHLEKAVKLGSVSTAVQQDLAEVLMRLNRLDESVDRLKFALRNEPYDPVLHKTLALRLITLKRYPEALEAMRRYVELFPEDDFMRGLLEEGSGRKLVLMNQFESPLFPSRIKQKQIAAFHGGKLANTEAALGQLIATGHAGNGVLFMEFGDKLRRSCRFFGFVGERVKPPICACSPKCPAPERSPDRLA